MIDLVCSDDGKKFYLLHDDNVCLYDPQSPYDWWSPMTFRGYVSYKGKIIPEGFVYFDDEIIPLTSKKRPTSGKKVKGEENE